MTRAEGVDVQLVHEFTVHVARSGSLSIGRGPFGTRVVGIVGGGSVDGERIAGELVGPAADWAIFGADGYAQVDVRAQIRTVDGADLFLRYEGSLEATTEMMSALRGAGSMGSVMSRGSCMRASSPVHRSTSGSTARCSLARAGSCPVASSTSSPGSPEQAVLSERRPQRRRPLNRGLASDRRRSRHRAK